MLRRAAHRRLRASPEIDCRSSVPAAPDVLTIDESAGDVTGAASLGSTFDTTGGGVTTNLIGTTGADTASLDGTGKIVSLNGNQLKINTGTVIGLGYNSNGGADALTLTGAQPDTVNVPSGTTTIAANSGTGIRQLNFSNVNIGATGKLVLAPSSATNNDYTKHGNRTVANISAGGLSITSGGTLDMGDNDMILHYAPANEAATVSQVKRLLSAGYDSATSTRRHQQLNRCLRCRSWHRRPSLGLGRQ